MQKTNKNRTKQNQTEKQPQSAMAHSAPALPNPMSAAEFLDAWQQQMENRRASAKADPQTEALVQAILEPARTAGKGVTV
jgi:hypothetical protein